MNKMVISINVSQKEVYSLALQTYNIIKNYYWVGIGIYSICIIQIKK